MKNTLSIALLLCVIAGTALAQECGIADYPMYTMEKLPQSCYDFSSCPTTFCTCVGKTFNADTGNCENQDSSATPVSCPAVAICTQTYIGCINDKYTTAADLSVGTENCTDESQYTMMEKFHQSAIFNAINPGNYSDTALFAACDVFLCGVMNTTGCNETYDATQASEVCVDPSGFTIPITPTPGSTPTPTNPDGSFVGPTKVIELTLTFAGNFDYPMSTADLQAAFKDALTNDLTKKLSYKTSVTSVVYTDAAGTVIRAGRRKQALANPSLTCTAEAVVPAGDTALLAAVERNVLALTSSTDASWLKETASACGCTVPNPTVSSITRDGAVPAAPEETKFGRCSGGCIAGVVVGVVVLVIVIAGVIVYFSMKKTAAVAPDPEK